MWNFIKSASNKNNWYIHKNNEICFIGRSNVGKSSLINFLAKNKKLSKTSKTPGRTQLINYFKTEKNLIVVDLPGYGFAKLAKEKQILMYKMIDDYFKFRKPTYVFLLIDSRRGISSKDDEIINYLLNLNHKIIFVLTKVDKSTQKELSNTLKSEYFNKMQYFLSAYNDEKKISKIRDFINQI